MKTRLIAVTAAVTVLALIIGCRSQKPPIMLDGKQVAIFVLSDRGIKSGMKEDEIKDRNEMGQFMEENLIEHLKIEGYNATLIQNRDQYVSGQSNYFVSLKINDLHLVSSFSFSPVPTFLWCQFEVSGTSGKLSLSYADDDSTTRDWTNSPRDLNERLVKKINDALVGKSK
jgi:hypothetical protein